MGKLHYLVEESARKRHDGEFITTFNVCNDIETAKKKYAERILILLKEEDLFLKDKLEKGNFIEHNLISSNGVEMPCLTIEDKNTGEYYELYVCERED